MWSVTFVLLLILQAYELSTLTGTQVLLLVASETGHVYTFATRKLQPMITSETGKALIQTCLNSPDSPPRSDPSSDQRMSATGFEETDLSYQVAEHEGGAELSKVGRRNWSQQRLMDVEGSSADWLLTLRCVSPPTPPCRTWSSQPSPCPACLGPRPLHPPSSPRPQDLCRCRQTPPPGSHPPPPMGRC